MSAPKTRQVAVEIFLFVIVLLVLVFTAANIENYLALPKVLAVSTQADPEEVFWNDFLSKNPKYIPGWVEIGRIDKAREIDPNYITP